jgi:hypothetical protein
MHYFRDIRVLKIVHGFQVLFVRGGPPLPPNAIFGGPPRPVDMRSEPSEDTLPPYFWVPGSKKSGPGPQKDPWTEIWGGPKTPPTPPLGEVSPKTLPLL